MISDLGFGEKTGQDKPIADFRFRIADCAVQAIGFRLQAVGFIVSGLRPPVSSLCISVHPRSSAVALPLRPGVSA